MEGWQKTVLGLGVIGGVLYLTNGFNQLGGGAVVVGSPKFVGFSGGKLNLQIPISNLSNLPVTFKGLNAYVEVIVSGVTRQIGSATIVDQKRTIGANKTVTFDVGFSPNWASLALIGISAATGGGFNPKTIGATLKGSAFTSLLTISLNTPLV
jgi:hypothetical protein